MFATTFAPAATIDATGAPLRSLTQRIADWTANAAKSFQMAKMLHVLAEFDDEKLEQIGITRSQIPAYAHKIVYGRA